LAVPQGSGVDSESRQERLLGDFGQVVSSAQAGPEDHCDRQREMSDPHYEDVAMPNSIQFTAKIRYWDEKKQSGLTVADIPAKYVEALGGRRQMRVSGTLNDAPFTGATMLVAGGGFCVGVTKDMMRAADVTVGVKVTLALKPAAKS